MSDEKSQHGGDDPRPHDVDAPEKKQIVVYVVTSEPGGPGPIFVGVFGTRAAAETIAKTAAGGQDFDIEEHMIETSAEEIRDNVEHDLTRT